MTALATEDATSETAWRQYRLDVAAADAQLAGRRITRAMHRRKVTQAESRRDRALNRQPARDRAELAEHARRFARQGRSSPPLPDACVEVIRRLKESDPPNGARDVAPRAPLDHYLARLYAVGWPAGALTDALDVASRDALHRRLRRVHAGVAGDCPPWVAELPCPPRPPRPR